MSTESKRPYTDRLELLQQEPNTEADLLEQHLGIRFGRKPLKATLDSRNIGVILTQMPQLRKGLGLYPWHLVGGYPRYGAYINNFDLVLVVDGKFVRKHYPLVEFHENIHGYVNRKNPYMNEFADEGIAMWGAIEAHGRMKGVKSLEQSKEYHTEWKRQWTLMRAQDKKVAPKELYMLSYNIAQNAMNLLMGEGFSLPEAFDLVIKNPFAGLQDSYRYPSELIKSVLNHNGR